MTRNPLPFPRTSPQSLVKQALKRLGPLLKINPSKGYKNVGQLPFPHNLPKSLSKVVDSYGILP